MSIQDTVSHKFLITGGGGYIGFHIGLDLLRLKHEVILFDLNFPAKLWNDSLTYSSDGDHINHVSCSLGNFKFIKGNT